MGDLSVNRVLILVWLACRAVVEMTFENIAHRRAERITYTVRGRSWVTLRSDRTALACVQCWNNDGFT